VRLAMTALGEEATRTDLQGYVRQKFRVKMTLDHISNCKGELAKRAAKATTPAGARAAVAAKPAAAPAASRKPAAPRSLAAQPAPAPQTHPAGGNGLSAGSISLEDVLTAKVLIDRVGAGPLMALIDGLAK
jgi:sRNA-binding protein